jgi:hypothetical protein
LEESIEESKGPNIVADLYSLPHRISDFATPLASGERDGRLHDYVNHVGRSAANGF